MTHKKIGIWLRVSTEMQVESESPEHHEKRARLYAEAKGWDVVEVYRLEAVSGKAVMEHPETKRMLSDIKSGKITGLIFSKLARLARNTKELLDFAEIFKVHNADLISLAESIDTSTPAGRLFYTMIAAMATWEREEIADRVAASVPIRAKLGKPLSAMTSLGYKWVNKEFVIDEKEAPIRKLIYELFLKTKRKKATARALNEMGYRTRSGALFTHSTIARLLRDTTAKGIRIANYTTGKQNKDGNRLKPESEWVFIPCPAIVSEELWNDCNALMDEQMSKVKKPGPKSVHLLSGYLYCSCGSKMYVYHKDKYPTYRCKPCNTKIQVEDIDGIFHEQLKQFLFTETELNDYLSKSDFDLSGKEQRLQELRNEVQRIRKRMDELVNLRLDGEMNKESFAQQFQPLETQKTQLDNQLPELEAEIDFLKIQNLSAGTVLQEAKDLYTKWPSMSFEEKRSIVETITDKITIDKQLVNVSLSYLPEPHPSLLKAGKSAYKKRNLVPALLWASVMQLTLFRLSTVV
jgi:site-specific DNA recombinase